MVVLEEANWSLKASDVPALRSRPERVEKSLPISPTRFVIRRHVVARGMHPAFVRQLSTQAGERTR
jgi:hypothetical protein